MQLFIDYYITILSARTRVFCSFFVCVLFCFGEGGVFCIVFVLNLFVLFRGLLIYLFFLLLLFDISFVRHFTWKF